MDLFLYTTIQIDRVTGSKKRKEEVEKVLKDNDLYCSAYVLGEYYATVVSDLVTLYGLFLLDKDIGETGKRITEMVFGRSQTRAAKLYANILSVCKFNVDEVEDTFLLYMDLIQDEFYRNLEEVKDRTKCARAKRRIIYEDGVPVLPDVKCRKDEKVCSICEFWQEAGREIGQITESEEIDEKIVKILCTAKVDEREYRGNNCRTLGDTVISVEAKNSGTGLKMCSSNKKDFQPLCNAIGLELVVPDYSWKNKGKA